MLLCSTLFSCGGEDPIELKEQMIENRKSKPDNPDDGNGDNPTEPTTPTDPKPTVDGNFVKQHFSFDIWKRVPSEDYFVPVNSSTEDPKKSYWVSASNYGYAYVNAPDNNYPVTRSKAGKKGSCVKLETKEKLGNLVAGAIYSGHIDTKYFSIRKNPARFGYNWKGNEPVKIDFFYQYNAGSMRKYGNIKKDAGAVRAVLYEVTNNPKFYLDKYTFDNHKSIVMRAFSKLENASDWTSKTVKFEIINQERYNSLDFENKKYRLAIEFSSSVGGAKETGIVGSILKIDEVTLYSKK